MQRLPFLFAAMALSLACTSCGGGGGGGGAAAQTPGQGSSPPGTVSAPAPQPIAAPPDSTNTMTLNNVSAAAVTNWPLQFGRAFKPGEISNVPGILMNGTAISSQADVMQRWGDGSVRFAVMSTVIPTLSVNAPAQMTFGNSSASPGALSASQLLAQFPDFDAQIVVSESGTSHSASARSMIQAGAYSWLAQGPLRYELLVADHVTRAYDFGFDAYKPLRPTFIVSFWPTLGQVRVRTTMEEPNLDALESQVYDLNILLGLSHPTSVYSQTGVIHNFGSRWTQEFWVGGTPEAQVNIDNNVAYLAATGMIPNYDPGNTVPESYMASYFANWQKKLPLQIFSPGLWFSYMPTTGLRDDIGPMPEWVEMWLSSGDWRMRQIALTSADLAGGWRLNFRENDATASFDRASTTSAAGLPISLNVHPTLWFPDNNGAFAGAIGGSYNLPNSVNWVADGAHQPEPFGIAYLLTGDYYYLESMQLWAAAQAMSYAPGAYGRGASGYGGITDQVRGCAWAFRSRAFAAALSTDGSPMKRYLYQIVDDALAYWSGQRGVADSRLATHPNYVWAAANAPIDWSPLRFWAKDTSSQSSAFWQESYLVMELGIARDMGFQSGTLLSEYSKVLTGLPNTTDVDPSLLGEYYTYTMGAGPDYAWFSTWEQLASQNQQLQPTALTSAISAFDGQGDPSYPIEVNAAASTITSYDGGLVTWYWLANRVQNVVNLSTQDRRWKLIPRATTPTAPPVPQ
jgi:hypothetical protein